MSLPPLLPPHHLHAGAAKSGVSFDIGDSYRVRIDGGTFEQKRQLVERMVFVWNMNEGLPMDVLASGAIRKFYDAVDELLKTLPAELTAGVEAAWAAIRIDPTADGHRARCLCSEKAEPT